MHGITAVHSQDRIDCRQKAWILSGGYRTYRSSGDGRYHPPSRRPASWTPPTTHHVQQLTPLILFFPIPNVHMARKNIFMPSRGGAVHCHARLGGATRDTSAAAAAAVPDPKGSNPSWTKLDCRCIAPPAPYRNVARAFARAVEPSSFSPIALLAPRIFPFFVLPLRAYFPASATADTGVGKSCLLLRYSDDQFSGSYISTIGWVFRFGEIDHRIRICPVRGLRVVCQREKHQAGTPRQPRVLFVLRSRTHGGFTGCSVVCSVFFVLLRCTAVATTSSRGPTCPPLGIYVGGHEYLLCSVKELDHCCSSPG